MKAAQIFNEPMTVCHHESKVCKFSVKEKCALGLVDKGWKNDIHITACPLKEREKREAGEPWTEQK